MTRDRVQKNMKKKINQIFLVTHVDDRIPDDRLVK